METNSVKFFKSNSYKLPTTEDAPILIAWKLRTPENYGSLIRLADTVGCQKVLFVYYSDQLSQRKIRKTAGDSYDRVDFEIVKEEDLFNHIPKGTELVAIETAENSKNIYKNKFSCKIALVVGNEKSGIDSQFLEKCDNVVHIPLTGTCTSLNVSHATAVALFEWVRQTASF